MSHATTDAIWRLEVGSEGISTLWFDQPGRSQNVLNDAAFDQLDAHLIEVAKNRAIRGLFIRSAKTAGFCAGVDLRKIHSLKTVSEAETFLRRGLGVFDRLSALEVPTVAVIHGACLGGGLELALACRRRVALASSMPIQLSVPDIHFGLIPALGGISRIPHTIGPDDGLDLLLTGRTFGYLLARSHGVVDRLASEGDSIESLDLLSSGPVTDRTWPQDDWESAWNRARAMIDDQPGAHPEAQLQILTIISVELTHGRETAREATVKAAAEFAVSDDVRDGLTMLFESGANPQA